MREFQPHHPSAEVLAAFAAGQEIGSDLNQIETHISSCEICAATLQERYDTSEQLQFISRALRTGDSRKERLLDSQQMILERLAPSSHPGALGRLGSFHLLEAIGKGAFGNVFRAFDETLHRDVAVKVLSPEFTERSPARQRFLREARSAAAIRHENVIRIHVVAEQPMPHLVMELFPGESLQARLDRIGPFSTREVVEVGRQVAKGLAAAHRLGLIHRDIKPANILVEGDDKGQLHVRLLDFGLARAVDDTSIVTTERLVIGTPAYMSPEQVNAEELDYRSDLFSLGSVLYTLCVGTPPFFASSLAGVLKQVAAAEPARLKAAEATVDQRLIRIVCRLMEKLPEDRFQSADEVDQALSEISCTESVSTVKPFRSEILPLKTIFRKLGGRLPGHIALLALLTLLTAVFVVRTGKGEFVMTTNDPEIAARIASAGGLVVTNRVTGQEFTLHAGPNLLPNGNYELVVTAPDGMLLSTSKFQLRRFDGEVRATVISRPIGNSPDAKSSPQSEVHISDWSEPERVTFQSGEVRASNGCISGDGLRVIFVNRTGGVVRLSESSRADWTSPFSVPVDLKLTVATGDAKPEERCGTPWVSANGLDLLVYYAVPSLRNGADIWHSHREAIDAPWKPLEPLGPEINSAGHDYAPFMSRDELELMWFRPKKSNLFDGDLWAATRSSTSTHFANAKKIGAGVNTEASEQHPILTADRLTLFFDRGTPDPRLWNASRATPDGEFTTATLLSFPPSWQHRCAYAPSITTDGRLLIFTSNISPGPDGFDTGILWQTRLNSSLPD